MDSTLTFLMFLQTWMSVPEELTTVTLMPTVVILKEVSSAPVFLDTLAMASMAHAPILMSVQK